MPISKLWNKKKIKKGSFFRKMFFLFIVYGLEDVAENTTWVLKSIPVEDFQAGVIRVVGNGELMQEAANRKNNKRMWNCFQINEFYVINLIIYWIDPIWIESNQIHTYVFDYRYQVPVKNGNIISEIDAVIAIFSIYRSFIVHPLLVRGRVFRTRQQGILKAVDV